MKITAVKTFLCNCYRTNWVFVKVAFAQKQKERDFIQAKRAIERIRMAI